MAIEISQITEANFYIGEADLLGRTKELKLPDLEWEMKPKEALGMIGKIELPKGIKELKGDLTLNSIDKTAFRHFAWPKKVHQCQVFGNLEFWDTEGVKDEIPYKIMMRAIFGKVPLGNFKQMEEGDWPTTLHIQYLKQSVGSDVIFEFDALKNIYKVADQDMMTKLRNNLGMK